MDIESSNRCSNCEEVAVITNNGIRYCLDCYKSMDLNKSGVDKRRPNIN